MVKVRAFRTLENALRRLGFVYVAGVDEVGRGCLAGPVVAAAVVLDPDRYIPAHLRFEDRDRARARAALRADHAASGRLGGRRRRPGEIDRINIHQASLRAMQRAVLALVPLPDFVLVDAFRVPDLPMAQRGVVHGDAPVHGDCGGVDRRQGDARPADARAARARSALRLRPPQGLRDARSPRRRVAVRLLRRAPPLVPAAVAV